MEGEKERERGGGGGRQKGGVGGRGKEGLGEGGGKVGGVEEDKRTKMMNN